MKKLRVAAAMVALSLLAAGCSKPGGPLMQRLDDKASATTGYPALRAPDEPTPLLDRPPFGLYAQYPSNDTLARLSSGTLSPDGRFRAATSQGSAWAARVDAAWLWQVPLPKESTAKSVATQPEWTHRGTMLFQDDTGAWLEADPASTKVTALPAAFQGKQSLSVAPDGKQVMYYTTVMAGRQLWVSGVDGKGARFLGENVIGSWDADGKPVATKAPAPGPKTATPATQPPLDLQ